MGEKIPQISEEMMEAVEKIFSHGESRAKNHDQRLGQWLVNKIRINMSGNKTMLDHAEVTRILFNMENQELWDLLKDYND